MEYSINSINIQLTVPTLMVSGGIMCIPSRFTVPRGSLVACMLPRELR